MTLAREALDEINNLLQSYNFLFTVFEELQRRNTTMDNDALDAMAGLLRRVSEAAKTEMVEAFPVKLLSAAPIFSNRSDRVHEVRRRTNFLSWSWAGWHAPTLWDS